MKTVTVNTSKTYDVLIGEGLLDETGKTVRRVCDGQAALIVTDDTVDDLYGDRTEASLRAAGYKTERFVFPVGESSKNMKTFTSILSAMAQLNLTRSDVVVALGGGVTGDMAGFAAGVYLRGTRFVQIPTTLLSMVDSSVGGKTGIDMPTGKNQIGMFYQPDVVICDIDTITTLPDVIFTDGCAEIIKHAIILSAELFELLKAPLMPQLEDIIARNVTIKSSIVIKDEKESGLRKILNFGHTIGHALEKLSNYSISHGRAVAIGMALAARGAYRMEYCKEDCYPQIKDMLELHKLPFTMRYPADEIIKAAQFDKKRCEGGISLIIPEQIGRAVIKQVDMDEFAKFVRSATVK